MLKDSRRRPLRLLSVPHLLPCNPVQKKISNHAGGKRGSADISDMTGEEANVSSFGTKEGIGSSGVALRYHTTEECALLPKDQTTELRKWRHGPRGKSGKFIPKNKPNNRTKAMASAVEKKVAERMKSMEQDKANEGVTEAYIMSIFDKCKGGTGGKAQISDVAAFSSVSVPTLKSIVKRAQNGKS
jgi:hypothetical protein